MSRKYTKKCTKKCIKKYSKKCGINSAFMQYKPVQQFIFVALVCTVLFLTACGKGDSDNAEKKDENPIVIIPDPKVTSVAATVDSLSIDLNKTTAVNFDVVTRFDDDSENKLTFTASWDAEAGSLILTDSNDAIIQFEYDVANLVGEDTFESGTLITITDDLLSKNIDVTLRLIPKLPFVSQLIVTFSDEILTTGVERELILSAVLSNGVQIDDARHIARCIDASLVSTVINVDENCQVTGLLDGDAVVSAELKNAQSELPLISSVSFQVVTPVDVIEQIDLVVGELSQIEIESGETINPVVLARWTLSDATEITDGIDCHVRREDFNQIGLNGCEILGIYPGTYIVTPEVSGLANTNVNSLVYQSLEVTVLPRELGGAGESSIGSHDIFIEAGLKSVVYQLKEDIQSSYKVKLVSKNIALGSTETVEEIDPLDSSIEMSVRPASDYINSDNVCDNAPALDKTALACGIDTNGLGPEINVFIEHYGPNGFSGDFSGELVLSNDEDILNNDNNDAVVPLSINDYQLLETGTPFDGHVSSNLYGANQSRYRTDTSNLLLSTATGYRVTVVFQPDQIGDYHFDLDSIQVGWGFATNISGPDHFCIAATCQCAIVDNNSIICDVLEGAKEDLFVIVYGNGADDNVPSPATADGELTYSVEFSNIIQP